MAFVGGKNYPLALPVDEISRGRQTKLRVFLVVTGVRQVIRVAELYQPRIFDAAIFFIIGLRREDRLAAACEVNPIGAFGVAQARSAAQILGAIKHYDFALANN